jgi:SAM-dependent methyltransferase
MANYARMYRFGITPWERYGAAAAASIAALLDREETERSPTLGRALDLGCGRGQFTPELARRGWEAVGIDYVPAAIETAAAKSRGVNGLSNVVGDVTRLPSADLGMFDFFLDIGCFQGLDAGQRLSPGEWCDRAGQARGHIAAVEFRSGPVAVAGWRRIAGGGRDRLCGLADARGRPGGHRGLGLADEHDRAAVVPAGPADLTRPARRWAP